MKEKELTNFLNKLKALCPSNQVYEYSFGYLYAKQFHELEQIVRIYYILKKGNRKL